ncbi:MAG: hypothetical protein IPG12_04790 [Saprospiraceae bacterium]|nr:hypothetical protein [Saprospiraceae bacterium]
MSKKKKNRANSKKNEILNVYKKPKATIIQEKPNTNRTNHDLKLFLSSDNLIKFKSNIDELFKRESISYEKLGVKNIEELSNKEWFKRFFLWEHKSNYISIRGQSNNLSGRIFEEIVVNDKNLSNELKVVANLRVKDLNDALLEGRRKASFTNILRKKLPYKEIFPEPYKVTGIRSLNGKEFFDFAYVSIVTIAGRKKLYLAVEGQVKKIKVAEKFDEQNIKDTQRLMSSGGLKFGEHEFNGDDIIFDVIGNNKVSVSSNIKNTYGPKFPNNELSYYLIKKRFPTDEVIKITKILIDAKYKK